jgi:hypothetical protein
MSHTRAASGSDASRSSAPQTGSASPVVGLMRLAMVPPVAISRQRPVNMVFLLALRPKGEVCESSFPPSELVAGIKTFCSQEMNLLEFVDS